MNRTASFAASVRGVVRRHMHSFSALLVFLALSQPLAQSPAHAPQTRPVPGPLAAPKTTPSVPYPKEAGRITFAAAGDVIPHQPVVRAAADHKHAAPAKTEAAAAENTIASDTAENHAGWDDLFAEVSGVFKRADFGFVNLETPVAPAHSRGSRPFQFDAPVALLQSLKANGVKIVSFANNHVFDQGHPGFAETLAHLPDEGLLFAGSGDSAPDAWNPVFTEKNGIKVGWLGMTRWLNGNRNSAHASDPHVAFIPYASEAAGAPGASVEEALTAGKAPREPCDFLIGPTPWAPEDAPEPRPDY